MLGWHKTFDTKKKSKLMDICVQLNRLTSEYSTRLSQGQYSNANKDPKSFETFYLMMGRLMKIIDCLANTLLIANTAIFSHLNKYEKEFKKESTELSAEEKTEHHIINQLKVIRKFAHEVHNEYPTDKRLEKIYEGAVRLDVFFAKSLEEMEQIHHNLQKTMGEVEQLLK